MFLRGDIVDDERVDAITVTVTEADAVFNSALAWRLTVADAEGEEFTVKIWHTHDVNRWWREDWRYVLKQARGTSQHGGDVVLHSTSDFSVHRPAGAVDLFAVGDSHIGRENRPTDGNTPYHTARQFVTAMGYAARYDVDAVVHAGDLFDDDPAPEDFALAESGFEILRQHGIPYYFVYGNHGVDAAESFYSRLERMETTHLSTGGVCLGKTVDVFGLDHGASDGSESVADSFAPPVAGRRRILVAHDEFRPPRPHGEPLENVSPPAARFDLVLSGHLHAPESAGNVQYLGSTAGISANQQAADESGWLIRVTPEMVERSRVCLQ